MLDEDDEIRIATGYKTDTIHTSREFKDGSGKFFTIVSVDKDNVPDEIDVNLPYPVQNKIKITLKFIKEYGDITDISFQKFKYYVKKKWVLQDQEIKFSYPLFKKIIGYLNLFSELNLSDISKGRITLSDDPDFDEKTRKQFNTLLIRKDGAKIIKELINSGAITSTDIVNVGYRKAQLEIFHKLLHENGFMDGYKKTNKISKDGIEPVWQHFFEQNNWIFGYGLNFVFNKPLEEKKLEQVIQGSDVAQSGKRTDGLLKTSGLLNSLCLIEIKTHKTPLLKQVENAYRADCWQVSNELSGGIAQSHKTVQKTIENIKISPELKRYDKNGNPTGEVVFAYQPKSYLLIGSLSEFQTSEGVNKEKFSSFELLRKNTTNPEIITFDELYERAKFIVHHK